MMNVYFSRNATLTTTHDLVSYGFVLIEVATVNAI